MPDTPSGQDVAAKAQELSGEILAKLDELTQQPPIEGVPAGVSFEERQGLAREAIRKMYAIVDEYVAEEKAQRLASEDTRAVEARQEIERIKASLGTE